MGTVLLVPQEPSPPSEHINITKILHSKIYKGDTRLNFLLVAILYWTLLGVSFLLLFWGLWIKSWRMLLWSGIALLPPTLSFYYGGAEGWFNLAGLVPLVIFGIAYYTKRKGS